MSRLSLLWSGHILLILFLGSVLEFDAALWQPDRIGLEAGIVGLFALLFLLPSRQHLPHPNVKVVFFGFVFLMMSGVDYFLTNRLQAEAVAGLGLLLLITSFIHIPKAHHPISRNFTHAPRIRIPSSAKSKAVFILLAILGSSFLSITQSIFAFAALAVVAIVVVGVTFVPPALPGVRSGFRRNQRRLIGLSCAVLSIMTILGAASVYAATVTVQLKITTSNGPAGTFTLSGCGITPATIVSNATVKSFTATNSCVVTVTPPADTAISQYRFAWSSTVGNSKGLINNASSTFTTCVSGTCTERDYSVYYETTTFSPTYSLSSWTQSIGTIKTDNGVQKVEEATGSLSWYFSSFEGCSGGNTTHTSNSNSFNTAGGSTLASLLGKYQIPFGVQVPMDGYGASCGGWGTSVVNQYSDMLVYNSTSPICSGSIGAYSCTNSWVRVDDMNLAKQTYNDLVAVKNAINAVNPAALRYWNEIYISSIGSDGGTGPNQEYTQATIWHFAKSSYCSTVVTTGANCNTLAGEVADTQAAPSGTAYSYLTGGTFGDVVPTHGGNSYGTYIVDTYMLGLLYASYNFSQRYGVGQPFVVLPAKPTSTNSCFSSTSLYPYPYNTTYIEGLNLCKYAVYSTATVENGGTTSQSAVTSNENICKVAAPDGVPGGFLVDMIAGVYGGNPKSVTTERNMLFYQAFCGNKVVMMPGYGGSGANWSASPTNSYFWNIQPPYAVVLNRMLNVGYHQFPKATLTGGYGTYPNISNVTLLGGTGVPLLAWFYTNKTGGATLSVSSTLTASTYHISSNHCEMSALTMAVLLCENSATITLSNVAVTCTNYPCWNPVYIFNSTVSSLSTVQYSSQRVFSTSTNSSALSAVFTGPHTLGAWEVAYDSQTPARVGNNRTGLLPQYSTLASLNTSLIGETYTGGTWVNETQQGWFYDSTNHLVYVHFEIGSPVQIVVNNQGGPGGIGVDPGSTAHGGATSGSTYTMSVTTSKSDDIIIVSTVTKSTIFSTSITDTYSLPWHIRKSVTSGNINGVAGSATNSTEFWAPAPSVLSPADTITVHTSSGSFSATQSSSAQALAMDNANFATPFDPNGAVPATASGPTPTATTPVSIGTSTAATSGQSIGDQSNRLFFHANGYYLAVYQNSPSGSKIYYQTCHDTSDCSNSGNWGAQTLLFSGLAIGKSQDFAAFYNYGTNRLYVAVMLSTTSVGWFYGNFSTGALAVAPSSPTNVNVPKFTPTYTASTNPSLIMDTTGDLIFGIPTVNAGTYYVEVWKCAAPTLAAACTGSASNIHTLNLGSPASQPYPIMVALANGNMGLVYASSNTNHPTAVSYTSCASSCSGDAGWSSPVATSASTYYTVELNCIQNAAQASSSTVYCVYDNGGGGTAPLVFLHIADGGVSWTEMSLYASKTMIPSITTDGSGDFVIVGCTSRTNPTACYMDSSSNGGTTWNTAQTLVTGLTLTNANVQVEDIMASSSSAAFIVQTGSASPFGITFVKLTGLYKTTPTVSGLSTTNNVDMVIGLFGYFNSTAQTVGTCAGATASSIYLGNGGTAPISASEYITTNAVLSSASCTFGNQNYNWGMIVDALQQAETPPVWQPMMFTVQNGATTTMFTLSGCGTTTFTVPGDGATHTVPLQNSCGLTVSLLGDTSGTATNRWNATGGSGSQDSFTIATCSTPGSTCSTYSNTYYEQLKNTCQATPTSNSNQWDTNLSITCTGENVGNPGQTLGTIAASSGGGAASASIWSDYNQLVTVQSPLNVSSTEQWYAAANTFTPTTGGNTENVNYVRQWQITMAISPADCGSVSPAGTVWETDNSGFIVTATPVKGCIFSLWSAGAGISFVNPALPITTATATASGTIIAGLLTTTLLSCQTLSSLGSTGGSSIVLLVSLFFVLAAATVVSAVMMVGETGKNGMPPILFLALLTGTVIILVVVLFGVTASANNAIASAIGC